MERKPDLGNRQRRHIIATAELEALVVAIEVRQACAGVADADARPRRALHQRRIVLDAEYELAALDSPMDRNLAHALDLADAVFDRVLDNWLQDEVGHQRLECALLHISGDLQSALEANLHDLEIAPQQVELFAHRDLLLARSIDRVSQQLAQP